MQKALRFIKKENNVSRNNGGDVTHSIEKQYFEYTCHDPAAECQIVPIVCRIVDKFNPHEEPVWQVDAGECDRCIKIDSRVLEDVYLESPKVAI